MRDRLRTEAWWVAGAGGVTLTGAALHATYGGWMWVGAFTVLAGIRPARLVWQWTAPRRAGVIPPAKGPRKAAEKVSPRLRAGGVAKRLKDDWGNVCREAQWSRGDVPPSLVYCRAEAGDTIALAWRPWINQGEKTWDTLAHTIRRAVDGQTVRWWINPSDSGLLEVRIGMKPLPDKIPLSKPLDPIPPDGSGAVVLGPRAGGGVAAWKPIESPHMLIAGKTRFGKGGTLRMLLSQVAPTCKVYVWAPKVRGEFAWLDRFPNATVVKDPADAVAMLTEVDMERRRREAILDARGLEKVWDLPKGERPLPLFLFIDELTEAIGGEDQHAQKAADLVVTLARLAAASGIHLVVATQRPDVAGGALGRRGGILREQLTARVVVGKIGTTGLGMVLEGQDSDVLAGLPGMPGRALVTGLDATGGSDVYVVQVAWLPQDAAGGAPLAGAVAEVVSEVAGSDTPTPYGGGVVAETDSRTAGSDIGAGGGGDAPTAGDAAGPRGVGTDISDPPVADGQGATSGPVDTDNTGGTDVSRASSGGPVVVPIRVAAERLGRSERTVRRWAADPARTDVSDAGWGRVALH